MRRLADDGRAERLRSAVAAATTPPKRLLLLAGLCAALWLLSGSDLWRGGAASRHVSAAEAACQAAAEVDDGSPKLPSRNRAGGNAAGLLRPWVQQAQDELSGLSEHVMQLRRQTYMVAESANMSLAQLAAASNSGLIGGAAGAALNATQPFLFIGVLTHPNSTERRRAVRETWMAAASQEVDYKFVHYQAEATPATLEEAALHGDMIFVEGGGGTDYRSIVYKTFALVQWVVANRQPKFILKTDDDAYVHTANLIDALRAGCRSPECEDEAVYMGVEKRNGVVITEEGHKWSNAEYFALTGIKEYAPYMFGGGYVFSADVARALVETNAIAPLKFMPNEDATFGFWVMGMDLRHVDQPKMKTAAGQCCFYAVPERDAQGIGRHYAVRTHETLCDGWLVLHKVERSEQMRYLHHRMQSCPEERELLRRAAALAAAREPDHPPPLPLRPLQVYAMSDWRKGFHFSGANDVSAWSADGRRLLNLRINQLPHNVAPNDAATIGYIPFTTGQPLTMEHTGWQWRPVAETRAWNYQLGARAQWVGASHELIVFNDRACAVSPGPDGLCGVLFNVTARRRVRELPRPVYALSPDGTLAAAVCMKRLEVGAPGWGYAASKAARHAATMQAFPLSDGLWVTDVATGKGRLVVSLAQLREVTTTGKFSGKADPATRLEYAAARSRSAHEQCIGWVDRPLFSRDGASLVFVYRVGRCKTGGQSWDSSSYLFTVGADGSGLWRVPGVLGGNHDFGADGKLLVCDATGTYLVDVGRSVIRLRKPAAIAAEGDGPCKFYREGHRWVLGDTYREPRKMYLWDLYRSDVFTVGILDSADWPGPAHTLAPLNPHWSPNGRYISFGSTHTWETGMQTYVVGVQTLAVQPALPPPASGPKRHIYCDLAVRSGSAMRHFLDGEEAPQEYDVHLWEAAVAAPKQQAALAGTLQAVRSIARSVTLHDRGAGVDNGTHLVSALGNSRYDVTMNDIRRLLFNEQPAKESKKRRRAKWWAKHFGGCALWQICSAEPVRGTAPPDALPENLLELQMEDFSAWLGRSAAEGDDVVITMDLGAGREFQLLSRMVRDGTIALVDKLYVRWHYQIPNWHWVSVFEYIFSIFGTSVEYLDEVHSAA